MFAFEQRGDYLIVGVHGDATVHKRRGANAPLLNLQERVLSILGCRYVDDVLIDSPYQLTSEMLSSLKISEVFRGTYSDHGDNGDDRDFRYKYAKEACIFSMLQSPSEFRLQSIVERINSNHDVFQAKFDRKMKVETQFYQEKYKNGRLGQ